MRQGDEIMGLETRIGTALTQAFAPDALEVVNESHLHAGHSGDDGSGESHWRVVMRAPAMDGLTRLQRHRAVHAALGPQIIGHLHALSLDLDG